MTTNAPKLYHELADWWTLLSAPEDYEEEAGVYSDLLATSGPVTPATVLELGSGGGNNASHMKSRFALTLVEPAAGMLDVSRRLNPECPHHQGDMRTVRLGTSFDAVFVHDAICYMTTPNDLRLAIETAFVHCRPRGVALFCPDHVSETFAPSTDHGGHDGSGRALRYLEWTWDPDPSDTTYTVDYAFLLRAGDDTRVVHDRHVEGLFSRSLWLETMKDVGFDGRSVAYTHSDVDHPIEMFLARRP